MPRRTPKIIRYAVRELERAGFDGDTDLGWPSRVNPNMTPRAFLQGAADAAISNAHLFNMDMQAQSEKAAILQRVSKLRLRKLKV